MNKLQSQIRNAEVDRLSDTLVRPLKAVYDKYAKAGIIGASELHERIVNDGEYA